MDREGDGMHDDDRDDTDLGATGRKLLLVLSPFLLVLVFLILDHLIRGR